MESILKENLTTLKELQELENLSYFWISAKQELILSLIEGKTVLDMGCGTGSLAVALAKKGCKVTAADVMDISSSLLNNGGSNEINFVNLDAERPWNFFTPFDCIILSDVLEHTKNDNFVLSESYRALKSDGVLIVTVPALPRLWTEHDDLVGHERRYTKKEIINKLIKAGFLIQMVRYWNSVGALVLMGIKVRLLHKNYSQKDIANSWLNRSLLFYFKHLENKIHPPFLGASLVLKCRKHHQKKI